ncbi:magnesium homeostasis factor-like protein [Reticulomyxa filosa]|uniref:Magnesium homeostasis factor-like protein n=1 Tax=Reticulomyxa filosa TaxID=46433 RepID=X6M9B6_RETFI|nr:magnesium homeostasis factor-like protein [Reticulomyxa filosa]|eukprot:ETO09610.1 magnesium homeostasis factor-like protein [Reticulomyxa filosa]
MHLTERENARIVEEMAATSNEWPIGTVKGPEGGGAGTMTTTTTGPGFFAWESSAPDWRRYDQLELIMENYLWQFEEIQHQMRLLLDEIEMHERTNNYVLNRNRNEIMRVNVQLTVLTMGISYCALLTSMFGMNLLSHFEDNPYIFWVIATSTGIIAPIAIYDWFKYRLKQKQILI